MTTDEGVFDRWWESLADGEQDPTPDRRRPVSRRVAPDDEVSRRGGLPSIRGTFRDPTWDEW